MLTGNTVFFAELQQKFAPDSFGKIGSIGPFPSAKEASDAFDRIIASREGEQLLDLLNVDRIQIRQTVIQ
jgi:hypothetical protein